MYVKGINVYVTQKYLDNTFDSCKNVQYPQSGKLALDMMCGDWGASCTTDKWFEYMGEPLDNEIHVPFKIKYFGHNNTNKIGKYTPHDPKTIPCNQAFNVSFIRCFI